jgi:hypothetical protein
MKCRICGCTDEDKCPGSCTRINDKLPGEICSVCYGFKMMMAGYIERARRVSAESLARLLQEIAP